MELEIKDRLDADDVAAVSELLRRVQAADRHRPIDESRWVDAAHGGRHTFAGLLLRDHGHDHPLGYAQVTRGSQGWAIDLVIDPHHRYDALDIGPMLLRRAVAVIGDAGGGHVHQWVYEPTSAHEQIARSVGLAPGRDLLQMRVPLPLRDADLVTRPFEVGRDEEAWVAVNNRAFAWHPEQAGWTVEDVVARESQPWFDPDGFLLHERDGRLAGFCWTKVHADVEPVLGEIYVIAVDPDFAGHGLGRALTLAGLASLHRRGVGTGMLYVDAGNDAAVGLYRDLGFTVDHIDRAFVGDVPPT